MKERNPMKKVLLLCSLLLVASVSAKTYEIGSANALKNLKACSKTDTVMITDNINMSNVSFAPLCSSKNGFQGVFDGGHYTISDLVISGSGGENVAFIAILGNGGVLKDLNFANPSIEILDWIVGSETSVAVVVGELQGGSIENVHVADGHVTVRSILYGDADAGGIVGTAESGSIDESGGAIDVSNSGFLDYSSVGGICGSVTGDVTLTAVTYTGNAGSIAGTTSGNNGITIKYGALTVNEKNSVKTAVIDGAFTAGETVKIPTDIEVSSITLNRTFNVNKVSTLYLPFEIDTAYVKGATIYKFKTVVKSEEDGRWKFKVTKAAKVLPNTPYVALPSASQVTFDIPESVTLNTTTAGEEAASDGWEFKGVYTYSVFEVDPENPVYFFADQERDGAKLGEFVITGTGAWLNPMRSYLVYHKGALAKSTRGSFGSNIVLPNELDIEVEDEKGFVVEKGRLNTVTGDVHMDRWYDLKGRRLNSRPSVKGNYYNNGKKVIIK